VRPVRARRAQPSAGRGVEQRRAGGAKRQPQPSVEEAGRAAEARDPIDPEAVAPGRARMPGPRAHRGLCDTPLGPILFPIALRTGFRTLFMRTFI